jgi:hypothetical protein
MEENAVHHLPKNEDFTMKVLVLSKEETNEMVVDTPSTKFTCFIK